MMILDELKNKDKLSINEQTVADYLLGLETIPHNLKTTDIAEATFTSPSTTVRLSKKLGMNGWIELRDVLIKEKAIHSQIQKSINPDKPFEHDDSMNRMMDALQKLEIDAIKQTHQLIHHDEFMKAIEYLRKANRIYIFAMANASGSVYEFQYKMRMIFKDVIIVKNRDDFGYYINLVHDDDCLIFVSYSGESFKRLHLSPYIKSCRQPKISVTGYHVNSLLKVTDAHLYIADQETLITTDKIGHFSSNLSIHYLFDSLYAGVFHKDYQKNKKKVERYDEDTRTILQVNK